MFEDWKAKLLLVIALIAVSAALVLGIQNAGLKQELATLKGNFWVCQDSKTTFEAQVNQLTGDLNALRNDYDVLRIENEQLKARRGGRRKAAQVR